jgi:ectoine hydroxylase-related dioxygenase (phytanoyl-CoA dioxygenase family)
MTTEQQRALDEQGYVVLEGCMGPDLLRALRDRIHTLLSEEGEGAGQEFLQEPHAHRLANLVDKGDVFQHAIVLPQVTACVAHVLGAEFKLSSLNARSADPHSSVGQPLHVDMGAIPDARGYWVCNTVWMLDDFTPENGATRMVPGSHRWGTRPQDVLQDPFEPHPDEVLLTGAAGTVAVMNAHLWHGGTANRSAAPRLAMHAFYCRADKPQQQYQKRLLRPEVQAVLTPAARAMLALDDPHNDAISAGAAPRSGFLK